MVGLGEVPTKSVTGYDESLYEGFENTTVLSWNKIVNQIKSKYSEANIGESAEKELEILSYTFSGRIDKIRLGDITLSGAEFREIFSLPSTNLEFKFLDNNEVEIISKDMVMVWE